MKKFFKNAMALLLAVLLLVQVGEYGLVWAADEVDKAVNPAEHIELTVPEKFQTGENLFFIAQADWATSEKDGETLYIPIQRSGDLDAEGDVTLKIVDLTAKHDVNYTAEIYKEAVDAEIFLADLSVKEIALTADEQEEIEPSSENEFGELIYEAEHRAD